MKYDITELLSGYTPPEHEGLWATDTAKLCTAVMKKIKEENMNDGKRRGKLSRTAIIGVAAAALLGIGALASAFGGFDWLREEVSPGFIDAAEPVEQSVTHDGIRFGIIAAQQYGEGAVAYVSVTDTELLGRVSEDCNPVFTGEFTSGDYKLIYFDAGTQTAVYEMIFSHFGELGMDCLLYNPKRVDTAVDADLADAYVNGEHVGTPVTNFQTVPNVRLTSGFVAEIPGANGAYVAAIGNNGGLLAVKFCTPNVEGETSLNSTIRPYLLTAGGTRIDICIPGWVMSPYDVEGMYTSEVYFNVDAGTLAGCTLCFEGTVYDVVPGDWSLDVDYTGSEKLRRVEADVEYEGRVSPDTVLTLSPIGLKADFNFEGWGDTPREAVLETETGEIKLRASVTVDFFLPDAPVDISVVTAVRIGDTRIELE